MTDDLEKAVQSFAVQKAARLFLEHGYYPVEPALMREIVETLRHAEVFIRTKERMHPTGQELYRELLNKLDSRWVFFDQNKLDLEQ